MSPTPSPLPSRRSLTRPIAALVLLASTTYAIAEEPGSKWPPPPEVTTVASVYDGDTMTLATGDKVRLRWVNTPELRPIEPYGIEARDAARAFLADKEVTLLLGGDNPRDHYGRLVAGLQTDEGNLSVHLIEQGYAHLFVIPPDETDVTEMLAAQKSAREARRGIWSTPSYQGVLHITSFHANAPGDDRKNVNGEYVRVCNVSTEPVDLEGYKVRNKAGKEFVLPPLIVPPGHTVKIHSGPGVHQTKPSRQLTAHLMSPDPVWNNKSDEVTLLDPRGTVVDSRVHEVKKETR